LNYRANEPLPNTMQAVVCYGPEDYRLQEWPVPEPGPEEIVIRVEEAGICASDIKCYTGAPLFWGDEQNEGYCQAPVIPGHEFVGEVVALGEGAEEKYDLALGDLAISEQIVPCWNCRFCQNGQYWMCQWPSVYGFRKRVFGAMAEYMLFPRGAINYKVPKSIPIEHAVYIEPLACAIHGAQQGNIEFQDVVVVAGAGPLGLGILAAAKLKTPRLLIALDLMDHRLGVAKDCGADIAINPAKVDAIDEVLKLTDGYGCDVYIEATGHPAAVEQGLRMTRRLGTFVEFSVMRESVTTDWNLIGDAKELTIRGAHLSPHCYPVAIDWLEKELLPMEHIVTHQMELASFQEGIDMIVSGDRSIKVTLRP